MMIPADLDLETATWGEIVEALVAAGTYDRAAAEAIADRRASDDSADRTNLR